MCPFIRLNQQEFANAPGTRVLKAAEYTQWLEAGDLVQAARQKAAQIKEAAVEAFDEEKQRGYREGLACARQKETDQIMVLSSRIIQYLAGLEKQVAGSVMLALKKILDRFEHRDLLYRMVATAIKDIRDQSRLRIRVAPLQAAALKEKAGELVAGHVDLNFLEIEADSRLADTDCMIETETGIIDAGLKTQLALIENALEHLFAMPAPVKTVHSEAPAAVVEAVL